MRQSRVARLRPCKLNMIEQVVNVAQTTVVPEQIKRADLFSGRRISNEYRK